ncbi:hypothetical protein PHMEG_00020787 [Phytophthora megakarya]|uniref:Ubiquitin-like protease family profile domain-containing protein n=1 Tax=Phytophthora megakarya TaxID=4795 RepID=A0A225VPS4_9STRA|nr:hypothetical protein PHMEG_00020787 [Phytophthora megakarya]
MVQKLHTAKSYGAADPGVKWLLAWSISGITEERFVLTLPVRPNAPARDITTLKTAVCTVVEQILDLTYQLHYEENTGYKQNDGSSCGFWCLVVPELLIFGTHTETWKDFWSDTLYDSMGYLRKRYLHKTITLQSQLTSVDGGENANE